MLHVGVTAVEQAHQDFIPAICWKFEAVIVSSECCESEYIQLLITSILLTTFTVFFFNVVPKMRSDSKFYNTNKAYPHVQFTVLCFSVYSTLGYVGCVDWVYRNTQIIKMSAAIKGILHLFYHNSIRLDIELRIFVLGHICTKKALHQLQYCV